MFRRIVDWLALTATERKVLLFLTGTLLIGAGIRVYRDTYPHTARFDYHTSDSTFAALSEAVLEGEPSEGETSDLLNLNSATKGELMDLPGIGEVLAQRIIDYRTREGAFRSITDLRRVKGFSAKKIDQLKHLITVQ